MREEQGAVFQVESTGVMHTKRYTYVGLSQLIDCFSFKVQASSNAEVSLWPMVGAYDSEYYVIVIGSHDNSKVELLHSIAHEATVVVSKDKERPLDPNHIRTFWVTWVNGLIRCGSGPVFHQMEFLKYQDPHGIIFNGLTMGTPQTDGNGHWQLGEIQGERVVCLV